ncbi:ComF family protein [Pedobacter sp.]|uniref:ComF family protein n=1 Tax=Pedobacter sp. TaxID=1411316 RepID=UPI003BAC5C3B
MLGDRLNDNSIYKQADILIPVPLHKKKLRIRGYNQSSFIAEGISEIMNIPLDEEILIRNTSTESQTKKNRYNRYENMKDVFGIAKPEKIKGKHILLIDDVVTTGATLEACANVLLECGAEKVSIAALAFAE